MTRVTVKSWCGREVWKLAIGTSLFLVAKISLSRSVREKAAFDAIPIAYLRSGSSSVISKQGFRRYPIVEYNRHLNFPPVVYPRVKLRSGLHLNYHILAELA